MKTTVDMTKWSGGVNTGENLRIVHTSKFHLSRSTLRTHTRLASLSSVNPLPFGYNTDTLQLASSYSLPSGRKKVFHASKTQIADENNGRYGLRAVASHSGCKTPYTPSPCSTLLSFLSLRTFSVSPWKRRAEERISDHAGSSLASTPRLKQSAGLARPGMWRMLHGTPSCRMVLCRHQ